MVAPALVLGLRGVQVLFSIIVLGLTAYRMSHAHDQLVHGD